jgi:hypothetical protein
MAELAALLSLLDSLGERLCEVLEVLEVLEWIDPGDMVSIEELMLRRLALDPSLLRFLVAGVAIDSEESTSKKSYSA